LSDSDNPLPARSVTGPDGRVWEFHERPEVRKEEARDHLTLVIATSGEVRVVSCLISEWESETPDLAGLLARSVPAGASRSIGDQGHHPSTEF
jgi:hypothetical protein